jgi:hypothetical protein
VNLQELVNTASSGATIQHDTEFVGNLIINKPLTIQGNGIIRSPNADPAIAIPPSTGPVSLLGKSPTELLKITHTTMIYDIIRWGTWQTTSLAEVPQGLSMQFCDVYGQVDQNSQRGIAINGANFSIKNSRIREIHWYKGEAQGICGWNGPGPLKTYSLVGLTLTFPISFLPILKFAAATCLSRWHGVEHGVARTYWS